MKIKRRAIMSQPGFVLLVTMIVLVVLATLATGLSVNLSMAGRRQQYMIEYQRARYGVDSGMKYILTVLPGKNFVLEPDRQEVPDFSDLFLMNQAEFAEFIRSWAETATDEQIEGILKKGASTSTPPPLSNADMLAQLISLFSGGQGSDSNDMTTDSYDTGGPFDIVELDPNDVVVPGPYGPAWPYVIEPIDLEIGPCKVSITIEDENAKMPLSWLVTSSATANKQAENALQTFCEWMSWDQDQLRELEADIQDAMDEIYAKKKFKLNPDPVLIKTTTTRTAPAQVSSQQNQRRVSRTQTVTSRTVQQTTTKQRPAIAHTTDFAKLFHSSLLDREFLANPLPDTGQRIESPLKYLSLWGAQRVNVNTAPRHVLEATFSLAMDSFDIPEFTQKVIEKRKQQPLKSLDELKTLGGLDAQAMNKLGMYLTTTSTFFQVRVTSQSGNARSSAVATVVKEKRSVERLVILYEQ